MHTIIKTFGITLAMLSTTSLLSTTSFAAPALAVGSLDEQPQIGPAHSDELMISNALTSEYNRGLIDEMELARFERDLDGIRTQEDVYRMHGEGMTAKDALKIQKQLEQLAYDIALHTSDKLRYHFVHS